MDTARQPGEHLLNRMCSALKEKSSKASESKAGIRLRFSRATGQMGSKPAAEKMGSCTYA